jgi:hypothetical protein
MRKNTHTHTHTHTYTHTQTWRAPSPPTPHSQPPPAPRPSSPPAEAAKENGGALPERELNEDVASSRDGAAEAFPPKRERHCE